MCGTADVLLLAPKKAHLAARVSALVEYGWKAPEPEETSASNLEAGTLQRTTVAQLTNPNATFSSWLCYWLRLQR